LIQSNADTIAIPAMADCRFQTEPLSEAHIGTRLLIEEFDLEHDSPGDFVTVSRGNEVVHTLRHLKCAADRQCTEPWQTGDCVDQSCLLRRSIEVLTYEPLMIHVHTDRNDMGHEHQGVRMTWHAIDKPQEAQRNVTVALLYALTAAGFHDHITAAQLALDTIEEKGMLPNIRLKPTVVDTSVMRALNSAANAEQYARDAVIAVADEVASAGAVAAVGARRSSDVLLLAPALGDTLLLTPSATAAVLSNVTEFPNFGRLCMPDSKQARALADLVVYFKWTKIVMVHCDDVYCRGLARNTRDELERMGVSLDIQMESSADLSQDDAGTLSSAIADNLAKCDDFSSDTMAGVLLLHHEEPGKLLLEKAAAIGLETSWLVSDGIKMSSIGHVATAVGEIVAVQPSGGGGTGHSAYQRLAQQLPQAAERPYVQNTYDAVMSLAYALQAVTESGASVENSTALLGAMREVEFDGASGKVAFVALLDRQSSFSVITHGDDSEIGASRSTS